MGGVWGNPNEQLMSTRILKPGDMKRLAMEIEMQVDDCPTPQGIKGHVLRYGPHKLKCQLKTNITEQLQLRSAINVSHVKAIG